VTGVIGGGLVAFGVITGLAVADAPMAVIAGAAFGMLGLTAAWGRIWWRRELRRCGPRWTAEELAALGNARALPGLLEAMPETWREARFR
jgi:hypothetical protein